VPAGEEPADAPGEPAAAGPIAAPAELPELPSVPAEEAPADDAASVAIPDFAGMSVGRALDTARARGVEVVVRGSGRCIEQSPPPGAATAGTVVTLRFTDGK
jgi:hypothetical protein